MNPSAECKSQAAQRLEEAPVVLSVAEIEARVSEFEQQQKEALGLVEPEVEHWEDKNPQQFLASQRSATTLLFGGLSQVQDRLIQAALIGLGYNAQRLGLPTNSALHIGKEYGNRAQCNPTYFTVGNLIQHLITLRDVEGISTKTICEQYLFITAGACGPCRFGTYATEYRKALRDAGFEQFRVMLFQQQGGLKQASGKEGDTAPGLALNPRFFKHIVTAIMLGDLLNLYRTRTRPYEIEPGSTDKVLEQSTQILSDALSNQRSLLLALWKVRKQLQSVTVNRLQPKPKVMIIGEFWAMTTEGDGNYHLQSFLEQEGAECDIQMVMAWFMFNVWEHRWDLKQRMRLNGTDKAKAGLSGIRPYKKRALLWLADKGVRLCMGGMAKLMGIHHFQLPDMDELAEVAHPYYRNEIRGGEGHMEVGKLILAAKNNKAHMVISVKPFGCLPSASVSDGIQSLITKKYPQVQFCPVETSGDGAVNFYSRIQMYLYKARQKARLEFEQVLTLNGKSLTAPSTGNATQSAVHYPRHQLAGTAANIVLAQKN